MLLVLLAAGCSERSRNADDCFKGSRDVDRSDLGEDWPLRVDHGRIVCFGGNVATFTRHGRHYAVTDEARVTGYADIERIAVGDVGPLVELADEACPG